MARPKKMGGRVAFYIPPGVAEAVAEIVALRTKRQGGLEARESDIYREAVVRGLPLVKAAELGGAPSPVSAASKQAKTASTGKAKKASSKKGQ